MEDKEETQTLEEAARETHLMPGVTDDPVLIYERQEQEKEVLSRHKHLYRDLDKWLTLFEDQITTCETVGVELSEEAKILYFMSILNDSIFGEVKASYMNLSTRTLYPRNYADLKQRMIVAYSQISTRKPHLVFKVIRGEEGKRHGEASFKAEEKGCPIC